MAVSSPSSSSTNTTQVKKYDVFLSFRGEDTRNNFTSHLYAALRRKRIETFIDNQLIRGDEISSSLLYTIKASKVSIIIFSKNFASSRWCLQELEQILECKNRDGQIVIPIFYQVDPSDVRNQTGTFGYAFGKLQERFKERLDELQRWKTALNKAAALSGWPINDETSESELIEEFVDDILERLNKLSPSDNYTDLVGVEFSIKRIESLLCIGLDGVHMVGIWGIGGIGKTTITRVVFDKNLSKFQGSYFFENVREESENNRLTHLKNEFLSTILEDRHTNIRVTFTIERLGRIKTLIVFDDVTCLDQIHKLIGDFNCLGSGSRIIITTRDKQVLRNCEVNDVNIFEVNGLRDDYARQLFKHHAFRQNPCMEDFRELSNKIIAYAKGLPLALKVLGSSLYSKPKEVWESAMNKLEKGPPLGVQKILKITYDGLEKEEKDIFLDIVCFFKGETINSVIEILNACDISAMQGISVLVDKGLITNLYDTITMHDLLQEMGREIVREECSSNDSSKQIRLWHQKDIYDVLMKNMGTETIRGISLDISNVNNANLVYHAFSKMHKLRFFKLYSPQRLESFPTAEKTFFSSHGYPFENKFHGFEDLEFFSTELTYFSWRRCPLKSLSFKFHSDKRLWNALQNLVNLTHINLSQSEHIIEIPNLSRLLNLKDLILEYCTSLLELTSSSIQNLNNLVNLDLTACGNLMSLPDGIQSKCINLTGCYNLKMAPKISSKVEKLYLRGTSIKELPFIEHPSVLVTLDLSGCSRLESLSSSICQLKFLQHLSLFECTKLKKLPDDLGNLEVLETLNAQGIFIQEIPSSILNLSKLSSLCLSRFSDDKGPLNWVPNSLSRLMCLKHLELINCQIVELPDNLGQLFSLEVLDVYGNNFESIPTSIKELPNLLFLNICYCEKLRSLPVLPKGLNMAAYNCSSLESILDSSFLFSSMSRPQKVNFANCFKLNLSKVLHKESFQEICNGICFPGNEIPRWFSYQNTGSFITLEQAPDLHNKNFLGFCMCAVVEFPQGFYITDNFIVECQGSIKSKDDKKIEVYSCSLCAWDTYNSFDSSAPTVPYYIGSDHVFLGFNKNMDSLINVWNQVDMEYEFHVKNMDFSISSIFSKEKEKDSREDEVKVKKCGIHFLYAQDCREPIEGSTRRANRDEENKKEESNSIKLQIPKAFEGESSSRNINLVNVSSRRKRKRKGVGKTKRNHILKKLKIFRFL